LRLKYQHHFFAIGMKELHPLLQQSLQMWSTYQPTLFEQWVDPKWWARLRNA
jgi:hypothetical protein